MPTGRRDRRADCPLDVVGPGELFAEPADHEQRVVDRQTEPEDGRDVDREGRDVGDRREGAQQAEGTEDGDDADGHREQRGHETAEDHEEQQDQHGHREHLGTHDVGLGEVLHLGEDDDGPADVGRPSGGSLHQLFDAVDLRLPLLLGRAGEGEDGEGAAPVAPEQAGGDVAGEAVGPGRERRDRGARREPVEGRGDGLLEERVVGGHGVGAVDHDDVGGAPAEGLLEQRVGGGALGPGVGEPAALDRLGDGRAEDCGDHGEEPREQQDQASAAVDERPEG